MYVLCATAIIEEPLLLYPVAHLSCEVPCVMSTNIELACSSRRVCNMRLQRIVVNLSLIPGQLICQRHVTSTRGWQSLH